MEIRSFSVEVEGNRLAGEINLPTQVAAPYPVVVICHGIPSGRPAENDPGYRPLAKRLAAAGFLSVIFNFRGCGESGGNIDLAGWCRDLRAILDMLYTRHDTDKSRMSLMGFSGGAAVSCVVAANDRRVSAVALMACPAEFSFLFKEEELTEMIARAREIGSIRDPGFPGDPQAWLAGMYAVRAEEAIGLLSPRPVLIVHGTDDEVVPVEHARRLYARAGDPREFVLLDKTHHRLRQVPEALQAAEDWLCRINDKSEKERESDVKNRPER
ncbi:MAG: alpha/beta fold hydrolase [Bacillota bacterium]|nr:alpha/beta fold hydrolase [Bacillota bacterium]MDW7684676.1 alpha/beta fold hydrolase [Bacillota bacterium]